MRGSLDFPDNPAEAFTQSLIFLHRPFKPKVYPEDRRPEGKEEMAMMYGYDLMAWWGWPLMMLFWVGVILLAVWMVRALFPAERAGGNTGDAALDTLKQRYARGEVTREEYEEGRRLLVG
jgi:putative membrane protein